jgi:ATP-dependent protease HslVU (ClpYQ) peptidase subunit
MTTVAVSHKLGSIACDLQFSHYAGVTFKGATKVLKLSDEVASDMFSAEKAYVGFAGNADIWGNVVTWFTMYEGKPPQCKGIEFLLLTEQGIWYGTNMTNWLQIKEPHFAIGSGMQFAMAAMEIGKTPIEACRIAGKYDSATGLGYKEYSLT